MAHRILAIVLAGALAGAAGAASAQRDTGQQAPPANPAPQVGPGGKLQDPPVRSDIRNHQNYLGRDFITARSAQIWRASDLIGKDVHSREDKKVGEVENLLIDREGRVLALVVAFGGTLGIGQNKVAVPMEAVSVLGAEPQAGTGDPQGTAGVNPGARATNTPGVKPLVNDRGTDDVPKRVVINLTEKELADAPKFESRPDR